MAERDQILRSGFLRSAEEFPDRAALNVEGETLSYADLRRRAQSYAATIEQYAPASDTPLTAVFAYRSAVAFAGVLGALLRGHGYVPLNQRYPAGRTRAMLQRSGCRAVIVDKGSAPLLDQVLQGVDTPLLLILPDQDDVSSMARQWPQHRVLGASQLISGANWRPTPVSPDSLAYLLFTSGSTGEPKGVMVANRNVVSFVNYMADRYGITEEDRFSQMGDMTFDLSVFGHFVAWERGACVCCPSSRTLIKPGKYIQESQLTVWFSVPSTALFMKRFGMLKPGRYPTLRWSLFCGEPLPRAAASAWAQAAPNSTLENLYGPTELTVACTLYRWDPLRSPAECENGMVPIGAPYPGMSALVVDEHLREVSPGAEGELLMTGPQMSLGYWKDPEKTATAFVAPPGKNEVYYRTGDRVRKANGSIPMTYLGRIDNQIKVLGHRVELGEIEAVLREESGIDAAIAVGWPTTDGRVEGIEAFLEAHRVDVEALRARVATRLPDYMVPRRVHVLSRLPLNPNGKYDRKALLRMLEGSL